jgi:hypothetical protein
MDSVSQNGRRKARPWTAQDQIVAEVAAACGVGYAEIGRALGRTGGLVKRRLILSAAEKNREMVRRWQKQNPDKVRENNRRWQGANPEKMRDYRRRWVENNPEKNRESYLCWREANLDQAREHSRRWHRANPDKSREKCRRRRKANPEWHRDQTRLRKAWKRAARRRALSPVTRAQIDARFALWNNRCAFCGVDATHERNHGRERLTVEHVLALTKGGLDEASNIIPACSACNSSKNNSPVEDWYRRQPFFTELRWAKIQRHCPAAVVGQLPLALAA